MVEATPNSGLQEQRIKPQIRNITNNVYFATQCPQHNEILVHRLNWYSLRRIRGCVAKHSSQVGINNLLS